MSTYSTPGERLTPSPSEAPAGVVRDRIATFYTAMDRTIRTWRTYGGRGALVERQIEDLLGAARAAVTETDVTVHVAAFGLVMDGQPLSREDRRATWLFRLFGDGVREITTFPGMDAAELRRWVVLLADEAALHDEDLVTRHANAGLPHVRLFAVNSFDTGPAVDPSTVESLLHGSKGGLGEQAGAGQVRLSPDEQRLLRTRNRLRWGATAWMPDHVEGATAVRHRYQARDDAARFVDIALRLPDRAAAAASPMVLGELDAFVREGAADRTAELLDAIASTAGATPSGRLLLGSALSDDRAALLAPLVSGEVALFLPALATASSIHPAGVVALLGAVRDDHARAQLEALLSTRGVDLMRYHSARLSHADVEVQKDAIAALGRIGTPEALAALSLALKSPLGSIREAAMASLAGRYHPDHLSDLARMLHDPERTVRQLALRLLSGARDPKVGIAMLAAVDDPQFEGRDAGEQDAMYRALAAFRDPRIDAHFERWLADVNVLRRKGVIRRQVLSAVALGCRPGPECRAALRAHRSSWHHPAEVTQAVAAALRSAGG